MNYRQGDVLLQSCTEVKGKKLDHLVIAKGEVTGHSHQITEGEAELYEDNGIMYLTVLSEKAVLTHEEHKKIELPKGNYEIKIQREYEPQGWRNVAD
jgi:hypothetical protein